MDTNSSNNSIASFNFLVPKNFNKNKTLRSGTTVSELIIYSQDIRDFFSDYRQLTSGFKEISERGYRLFVPLRLKLDRNETTPFYCTGSAIKGFNFLFFSSDYSELEFIVIQHNSGVEGVLFPQVDVLVSNNFVRKRLLDDNKLINQLRQHQSETRRETALLGGFIHSGGRPYHYFYDRFPSLVLLSKKFPLISVYNRHDIFIGDAFENELDFYDFDKFGEKDSNYFLFQTYKFKTGLQYDSHVTSLMETRKLLARFLSKSNKLKVPKHLRFANVYVVWIGLCQEKRTWPGIVQYLSQLVSLCRETLGDVVFIFDGLTRPESKSRNEFVDSFCQNENKILHELLNAVEGSSYYNLIGCSALEKISYSQHVDFFFTNSLTDSMWPAHFGRAMGVSYSSTKADRHLHDHPLTSFIPSHMVHDDDSYNQPPSAVGCELMLEPSLAYVKSFLDFVKQYRRNVHILERVDGAVCRPFKVYEVDSDTDYIVKVFKGRDGENFQFLSAENLFKIDYFYDGDLEIELSIVKFNKHGAELKTISVDSKLKQCNVSVKDEEEKYSVIIKARGFGKLHVGDFIMHGMPN